MESEQQLVHGRQEADLLDDEASLVLLADARVCGALPAAAQLPLHSEIVHNPGIQSLILLMAPSPLLDPLAHTEEPPDGSQNSTLSSESV